MSSTSTDVWSSTSSFGGNLGDSFGSERIERFVLQEEKSRLFFNCDHHFFDDDGNDANEHERDIEGSFSAEICTKEEQHCLFRFCSSMRNRHPRHTPHKISPSGDQVFVKFSCNDGGDRSQ